MDLGRLTNTRGIQMKQRLSDEFPSFLYCNQPRYTVNKNRMVLKTISTIPKICSPFDLSRREAYGHEKRSFNLMESKALSNSHDFVFEIRLPKQIKHMSIT